MLGALWPRMSRRTGSDTPISAARELHVCLRSWNVRLTILASRHAVNERFLSVTESRSSLVAGKDIFASSFIFTASSRWPQLADSSESFEAYHSSSSQ